MQILSKVLEHMPYPSPGKTNSTSLTRQAGSTLDDGMMSTLREMAQGITSGKLLDDRKLEMLLVQLLGSSRFASKPKCKHVYGDQGDYDYVIEKYEIKLDVLRDDEMKLYEALDFFNKPAPLDFVAKQIGRLQAVMARRSESNDDLAVVLDTYSAHLDRFPPDVVSTICWRIIENKKWFPLVNEMVAACEEMMKFRRAVWESFQIKRHHLLSDKHPQQIEADPRLQESWKNLPKREWLLQHFEWAIGECQDMLNLALQYPHAMNVEMWEEKIAKLKEEQSVLQESVAA